MTGRELLRHLRVAGHVYLWIGPLDAFLPLTKTYLVDTLRSLADIDTLDDINVDRDEGGGNLFIYDWGIEAETVGALEQLDLA